MTEDYHDVGSSQENHIMVADVYRESSVTLSPESSRSKNEMKN